MKKTELESFYHCFEVKLQHNELFRRHATTYFGLKMKIYPKNENEDIGDYGATFFSLITNVQKINGTMWSKKLGTGLI